MECLSFGKNNSKLQYNGLYTFSLSAGYTCPGAKDCLAKVQRVDGKSKVIRGACSKFTCFAASDEARYTAVYESRKRNFELLRQKEAPEMQELIQISLPKNAKIIRIHVSGDFFNQNYFDAWLAVAAQNKHILFYAYTKSLHLWVNRLGLIPNNFVLTASKGGVFDTLIEKHNLRTAEVVFHPEEAEAKGLEIDHDDSHAMNNGPSFALLLHGAQAANSKASKALKRMNKEKIEYSYNSKKSKPLVVTAL